MRKCTKSIPYLLNFHFKLRNISVQTSLGSIQQNSLQTHLYKAGEFQKDVQIFCSKRIKNIFSKARDRQSQIIHALNSQISHLSIH